MAKTRLFGESISPGVVQQLKKRAEVLSKGVRQSNELRYLNEKTSWVRMISGVDTQIEGVEGFTSTESQGFILSGGEVKWDGKAFVRRQGFKTSPNEDGVRGRYNYDKDLGIRPEAGITSFSIRNTGTYGVLRQANLNFNVWTREDLEKAQNLFLRPGMSVIIEWGNSIFLDENGNVKDTLKLPKAENYFKKSTAGSIADLLKQGKEDNSFNYDAFLGYITNFSWSFRPDGGYDCSITAVSKGAVLESISTYNSTQAVIDSIDGIVPSTLENVDEDSPKTYMHYVLKLFEKTDPDSTVPVNFIKEYSTNYVDAVKKETSSPGQFFVKKFAAENGGRSTAFYINLNTLCAILNIGFIFKNPNGDRITSFYTRKDSLDVIEPSYVTFEDHFSLNPLYCLLPKIPVFSSEKVKLTPISEGIVDIEGENKNKILSIYVNFTEVVKDLDVVLKGEKDPQQANVFDLVKNILRKLNAYLGGINSFDLSYDEDIQKWIIIDRNSNFSKAEEEIKTIQTLDVVGLKSTVSNISLVTKITPQLSSQIAISAQASKVNHVDINLPLAEWNATVADRFSSTDVESIFVEDLPPRELVYSYKRAEEYKRTGKRLPLWITREELEAEQNAQQQPDDLDKYIKNVEDAYSSLQAPSETEQQKKLVEAQTLQTTPTFDITQLSSNEENRLPPPNLKTLPNFKEKLFEKIKSESYTRFNNAVYGTDAEGSETITNTGLIPIEVEVTLDGISGLKIGQIFRIGSPTKPSTILPSIYNDYGFVITGLDSTVENSKWFTTIRGLTFRLENNGTTAIGKLKV